MSHIDPAMHYSQSLTPNVTSLRKQHRARARRQWLGLISVVALACCTSCARYLGSAQSLEPRSNKVQTNTKLDDKVFYDEVIDVEAKLTKGMSPSITVAVSRIDSSQSLHCVFFLNEMVGWVGGTGGLYRTDDGGKVWGRVNLEVPAKAAVAKIHFSNPKNGWAVLQKSARQPWEYTDNHVWLYATNDGGNTWNLQLEGDDSEILQLRFLNEKEAWLVGRKFIGLEPFRAQDFIMHTSDAGKNWVDVAYNLNRMLAQHRGYLRLAFTDVRPEAPLAASVLMPEGRIFRTPDGGQTWQQLSGVLIGFNYISSNHLGGHSALPLWVAGGKDDWKSALGMFAVKEGDTWKKRVLPGVFFSDVSLLSATEIVAVGSMPPHRRMYTDERSAVITYSVDGGQEWSIVYRNLASRRINAVTTLASNTSWAVGDGGLIVRLEPKKNLAQK